MTVMKNKWLLIVVFFPALCFSQKNTAKARLTSIAAVGFAAGESTAKPLFQLSGGFSYGRSFMGIGAGLDQYKFNSIPLFADWRYNFGKARVGFLYANGGYNFPGKNKNRENNWFDSGDNYSGGFYIDAGLGYRIRLSNPSHRLLFSAGYSRKTLTNKVTYTYECLVPPCPEHVSTYKYELGRILAKFSWEFGK
jgi:hypothetical protein